MFLSPEITLTSESVTEGHPDKVADQLSDAILDAILTQDPSARVSCECLVKTELVLVAGEMTTHAQIDIESIVREQLESIGYNAPHEGFDSRTCAVMTAVNKQSKNLKDGIGSQKTEDLVASDQGVMVGFATNETPSYMPLTLVLAHNLVQETAALRHAGDIPWLLPDGKAQVSILYKDQEPFEITSVVLSAQHTEGTPLNMVRETLTHLIVGKILPSSLINENTQILINPLGAFHQGGPLADCGVTGRKLMVDTYGGIARHGGGAFSGKDPSKLDRTGAYFARYIAKNIVGAHLATRCEVHLAYIIGRADPCMLSVHTFGTGVIPDHVLSLKLKRIFDCRPNAMIERLSLLSTPFLPLATYGHMGRDTLNVAWERLDALDDLHTLL